MSNKLANYFMGNWVEHEGDGLLQHHAITGELLSTCGSDGLDYASMLDYGRRVGGPALRRMTFQERGRMLKALALYLTDRKEKYYEVSYQTGATRGDSWIDIDGGIGTLFAYASLRRRLPDETFYTEGDLAKLSQQGTFIGHHIMVPRHGVAVHINAYNFPIWGMLEKISATWMAGMSCVVKPSEVTSYVTEVMVRDIIESGIIPEGALQLVCGSGFGILDPVREQDVVTFTGSAHTGRKLKTHPSIIAYSVPFNMEADSLNAAVLGPDAAPGTPEFDLFIKEIRREVTAKTGQKCTAIRRVIVPETMLDDVQTALIKAFRQTTIGDPRAQGVRMGALVSRTQVARVRASVATLTADGCHIAFGDPNNCEVIGADAQRGAFMSPILLRDESPTSDSAAHQIEVFGPVCTVMPYKNFDQAIEFANAGRGSLVSTVCTAKTDIARRYALGSAAWHGRILVLNRDSAPESTGHGSPMPLMNHGGPGRAGGGAELGGLRSVLHYLNRTALQGSPADLTAITKQYQYGTAYRESDKHPFRKYFDELEIGDTVVTHKHTVSEADISNFANVSGDNFYAHTDVTALEGTPFTGRVAHGYFVLSKAAGLFVEPRKGPVLLNYGLDECRFTKPVYPGMTIGVRLTCKEKIEQEVNPTAEGIGNMPRGIVKWLVDVYDETNETVAIATILTMVAKKNNE